MSVQIQRESLVARKVAELKAQQLEILYAKAQDLLLGFLDYDEIFGQELTIMTNLDGLPYWVKGQLKAIDRSGKFTLYVDD